MVTDAALYAEVHALIAETLWLTDQADLVGLMAHIAEDAVFSAGDRRASGAAAVRAAIAQAVAVQGVTRHMMTNLRLLRAEPGWVECHCVVLVTLVKPDRRAVSTLDYRDRLVRNPAGTLLIESREMTLVSAIPG